MLCHAGSFFAVHASLVEAVGLVAPWHAGS